MWGKCWKTKRGDRLLPPGIGHKDEKKEEENQRMTWRACSILPTMLLFSRCYVALFLDDGTGGRAAYAPLFVPTYPVYRCLLPVALSLFLLSSYGIPRESVSSTFKHRQMFARRECYNVRTIVPLKVSVLQWKDCKTVATNRAVIM